MSSSHLSLRYLCIAIFILMCTWQNAQGASITVFAAASLNNAVEDLARLFQEQAGIAIRTSFAGSSTLAKQIENGAPVDFFISADQDWMNYLEERKLIIPGTRFNLVANELVLVAPVESELQELQITPELDLNSLIQDSRIAVGDPDHVPAGKYARKALESLGLWKKVENRLARANDVRGALALVERGEAPLGIVYSTDAAISKKVRVVGKFPKGSYPTIVYPAALTKQSQESSAFMEFLRSPQSTSVFQKYGFREP